MGGHSYEGSGYQSGRGSKGKGHGKRSQRSQEEQEAAAEVNRWRRHSTLPAKSTGSVSRSKARSAVHHAAKDRASSTDASQIGPPAVTPPKPPPPRRSETGVRAVAGACEPAADAADGVEQLPQQHGGGRYSTCSGRSPPYLRTCFIHLYHKLQAP